MNPQQAADEPWSAEWETALHDLELSLARAEELLRGPELPEMPHWTPPTVQGPPPPNMLARAQALLQRQQRVIASTTAGLTSTRKQLALTRKMDQSVNEVPVYLDTTA